VQKDAIFSGAPAVSAGSLFYQSIADDPYVLRWLHEGTIEELQIWLRNAATGKEQRVTGGNCNSAVLGAGLERNHFR
jgi:hypothetical protein